MLLQDFIVYVRVYVCIYGHSVGGGGGRERKVCSSMRLNDVMMTEKRGR